MPVVIELLNKGLVTARDPALLRSGELQRADDCIYRPNDQAIWKAPGRVGFGGPIISGGTPVKGIRYLDFDRFGEDRGDDYVVAHASSDYYYGVIPATATGSPPTAIFSLLTTAAGNGQTLDSAHYGNRYYLFNGNLEGVANVVVKPATADGGAPTIRTHGFQPVTDTPALASASGAGWYTTEQGFGDDYYFIITTEVINPGAADEVESTWAGSSGGFSTSKGTGVYYQSGTTDGIVVTKPATVNPTATHWKVYLAGPYKTPDWNQSYLMLMYWQATIPIAQTTITLGANVGGLGYYIGTATAVAPSGTTWDNPSLILGEGNGAATGDTENETIVVSGFGTPTASVTGTVWGISVQLSCKIDLFPAANLNVQLYHASSPTGWSTAQVLQPGSSWAVKTVGGPGDAWGYTWTASDIANLKVMLTYKWTAAGVPGVDIDVDWVKVAVNAGAASVLSKAGPMFPYTAIQVGSIITIVGSNGPPPVASTGDIFEGQLVLNNMADPSKIHYSLPDGVDYFPTIYFVSFETKENDSVTYIRRLGDKLVVGLRHQVYRVNYLPRGEDSEFDRGRCYEAISEDHGIVGCQAGALFCPPDRGQLLAYVSSNGIHATDGFTTTTLTEDLDWQGMVKVSDLYRCVLVNYPRYSALVFYYVPYGSNATYPSKALWMSYHPSHVKEGGKLLISGPVRVGGEGTKQTCAAHVGKYLNETLLLTSRNDGMVYVEDQGWVDAAGDGIYPDIVTRDLYAAGIGYEYTIERLWFRHYQHLPASIVNVTPYWRNTEGEYMTPVTGSNYTPKSFTTAKGAPMPDTPSGLQNAGCLSRIDQHLIAESFAYRLQEANGGNGMAISWMAMEAEGHGLEEKR